MSPLRARRSPLLTPSPGPKSATASLKRSETCRDLVLARCRLLGERTGDRRTTEICKRVDGNSGKLLPAPPSHARTKVVEPTDPTAVYFLHRLSRRDRRAQAGDPTRRTHLHPSSPTGVLRTKLKEQIIERRWLQRQEEAGKGRPRRAMSTLRALVLKGNQQAEAEYFQRREEEEQATREASKRRNA